MANENEIKEFQTKIREVQKENDELASKLAKKERECEIKDEEQVRQNHGSVFELGHFTPLSSMIQFLPLVQSMSLRAHTEDGPYNWLFSGGAAADDGQYEREAGEGVAGTSGGEAATRATQPPCTTKILFALSAPVKENLI